ncbi:MAG: tRNA pseudouridine(38-40) synthase TruA [Bacillota bacterium]|nr:tRNA pseudouridine(38-40) synthase TruA [Bacillota bacterium]
MEQQKQRRQIKLTIAYDGTAYCGYQVQPNGVSVSSALQAAVEKIAGHPVSLMAASRTDAGVHATGQVATFFLEGSIPVERIPQALHGILPKDVVVWRAEEVPPEFHCRHDAVGKHYRYTLRNHVICMPFDRHFVWHYPPPLNVAKMEEAVPHLVGERDFRAFTAAHSGKTDFVRRLDAIEIQKHGDDIIFDFWGQGFLYKMVRSITGFLVDVGRGFLLPETAKTAIETGNRSLLGLTAPPQGLNLVKIYYDEEYFLDKMKTIR